MISPVFSTCFLQSTVMISFVFYPSAGWSHCGFESPYFTKQRNWDGALNALLDLFNFAPINMSATTFPIIPRYMILTWTDDLFLRFSTGNCAQEVFNGSVRLAGTNYAASGICTSRNLPKTCQSSSSKIWSLPYHVLPMQVPFTAYSSERNRCFRGVHDGIAV